MVMSARERDRTAEVVFGNAGATTIVEDVQGGWHVQAWLELRGGTPQISELRIRPAGGATMQTARGGAEPQRHYPHEDGRKIPKGGITSAVLRAIQLRPIHAALRKDPATVMIHNALGVDLDRQSPGRPGRRGRDDAFYAVWAARYVEECQTTRSPYRPLSARFHYSEDTIRDFVGKAGKRGLIVGRSAGRAGGRLSAKAERLLAATGGEDQ
jgi:hypothetical protein